MFNLYFGSTAAIQTTILVVAFASLSIYAYIKRMKIHHWGWLILAALALGLYICVAAATRDGYHLSVQYAIDGSVAPGLFQIASIQSIINCALAAVIVFCGILSIFLRKEKARKILFFVIATAIIAKVAVIEVSRITLYFAGHLN